MNRTKTMKRWIAYNILGRRPPPTSTMRSAMMMLAGVGTGAAATYLLDPVRGRRRRALLGDQARHLVRVERQFLGKAMRDAKNRSAGMIARARGRFEDVSDDILHDRVRAELGHHVSHSGAIDVSVRDGVVTLRGPIISDEIPGLLQAMHRVRGLLAIENALEPHESEENIPALQGGYVPSRERAMWTPAARLAAGGAGVGLTAMGLLRRGPIGTGMALLGGALLMRTIADRSFRQIVGLDKEGGAVTVSKSITVNAPLDEVYSLWANLENFPQFFTHVDEIVVLPDGRSEWHVKGPGGMPLRWIAETIDHEPRQCITWRTISGRIFHTGSVRFEPVDDYTTRVHVRMAYRPPAGSVGHSIAALLGQDPKHTLDRDMMEMKSLFEQRGSMAREEAPPVH